MIVVGDLSTGNLMSLLTYCMNILMNLMMLSMIFVMLTMSAAAGKRICEVLNEKSTLTNPEYPDYDIPDGSIVAYHSVVTRQFEGEKLLLGGFPAKVIEEQIEWVQ